MRENTRDVIITKPALPTPTVFEKYVQYVREHTTELSCHHHKFYWHACTSCRRDKQQATAYAEYYKKRIYKVLNIIVK